MAIARSRHSYDLLLFLWITTGVLNRAKAAADARAFTAGDEMSGVPRELQGSPVRQGAGETIVWPFQYWDWLVPEDIVIQVIDESNSNTDVTATVCIGGASSVVGKYIHCRAIHNLVAGHTYKVIVKFDSGVEHYEHYFRIEAE